MESKMRSKEKLDKLCKISPPEPLLFPIARSVLSVGGVGGTAALVNYMFASNQYSGAFLAGVGGLVCLGVATKTLSEVILHRSPEEQTQDVYFYNEGFTKTPNRAQRAFGHLVTPVDACYQKSKVGMNFLDGIVLHKYHSEKKYPGYTRSTAFSPWKCVFEGKFQDQHFEHKFELPNYHEFDFPTDKSLYMLMEQGTPKIVGLSESI